MLLVHTSFRAVRPVEGGPAGLIDALRDALGPAGTLVMPSWSGNDDEPFDPLRSPAAPDLGVVADTFWRLPAAVRSNHPFAAAALGPHAGRITSDPLPLPPHGPASPVGRVHELDGQVLLLGVGHSRTRRCTWRSCSRALRIGHRGIALCSTTAAPSGWNTGKTTIAACASSSPTTG